MMSAATRVQPSISETHGEIMAAPLIDYSAPRAAELPAAPSTAPARPASEDASQRSRAIIPGDDPRLSGSAGVPLQRHLGRVGEDRRFRVEQAVERSAMHQVE